MSIATIEIVMAFDFGTKNIGIAVGQKLTCTAQPIAVLKSISGIPNWKNIEHIYNEWKPIQLIVGLPLNIDGSEQYITLLSKKFAMQLKKRFKIKVNMHDERFTTTEAREFYSKYNRNYILSNKKKTK